MFLLSLSLSLPAHKLTHTNEVNEDECGDTVLLTTSVSNCGPVLQGHRGKTSRGTTKIDLTRRTVELRMGCSVNHN